MTARVRASDVSIGEVLPPASFLVRRVDLVRYAGASGDFNVIHWNERIATSVGLPNVIAHGMLTMAEAIRVVTDWLGDPGAVLEYGVRFTRPVIVPDDEAGATIEVNGSVAEMLDGNRAKIAITASCGGQTVLGKAIAIVQLA